MEYMVISLNWRGYLFERRWAKSHKPSVWCVCVEGPFVSLFTWGRSTGLKHCTFNTLFCKNWIEWGIPLLSSVWTFYPTHQSINSWRCALAFQPKIKSQKQLCVCVYFRTSSLFSIFLHMDALGSLSCSSLFNFPSQTNLPRVRTFDILHLVSVMRKDMLLISFWTTKFCSSLLKFCRWKHGNINDFTVTLMLLHTLAWKRPFKQL